MKRPSGSWPTCRAPIALAAAIAVAAVQATRADDTPMPVYTLAQAQAGEADYALQCAGCHGNALQGGAGPTLIGKPFLDSWGRKSTRALYDFVSTSMPPGSPGSLSPASYASITAFILQSNGAAAGVQPFVAGGRVLIGAIARQPLVPP